jgi:enoyl-CoA hydratase/carnithine racemase
MDYETILFEVRDRKGYLTLNRPESLNAFNGRMQLEIRDVWMRAKEDPEIRVVVLTGAGDRAFCSGADRKEGQEALASFHREFWHREDPSVYLSPKMNRVWKPVVCAVNGIACGGAFYFIAESDVVIASEEATFFDPHVTYATTAVLEPVMLSRRMPLGEVLRMALLGNDERMSAARAHQVGLVSEVVPRGQLAGAADWVADRIAEKDPAAVQGTVRAIWTSLDMHRSVALDIGLPLALAGNTEADSAKAAETFLSANRPPWRLR